MDPLAVRSSFYEDVKATYGFDKPQVIQILNMAEIDTTTFNVELVEEYFKVIDQNAEKFRHDASTRVHATLTAQIEKNRQAKEARKCPICGAEISPYLKNKWRCSVGGFEHYRLADPRHQREEPKSNESQEIPLQGQEG